MAEFLRLPLPPLKFLSVGNYELAWIQDSGPTPQALAMIQLFKQAGMKGLRPEDYDGSIWNSRLPKLQGPQTPASVSERVHFDLAMSVCAMRYISDLRIGASIHSISSSDSMSARANMTCPPSCVHESSRPRTFIRWLRRPSRHTPAIKELRLRWLRIRGWRRKATVCHCRCHRRRCIREASTPECRG
jgi:hypothetical protein